MGYSAAVLVAALVLLSSSADATLPVVASDGPIQSEPLPALAAPDLQQLADKKFGRRRSPIVRYPSPPHEAPQQEALKKKVIKKRETVTPEYDPECGKAVEKKVKQDEHRRLVEHVKAERKLRSRPVIEAALGED
ncbi:unnamed protein product [Vitrella brassicaformis CCMP3155]|uniref:Uncharacterized protein n=1 Tax=Vitrella brassicaformis (strain CCMP3155) TaxID=1169540 RepID=A0A0G4EC33_VITBC|nr:unnamed protein product [Vitrella brassicaformis CCMP3155]|eukprot:CEL92885.1 unnamed protein product [Vitrella brassicaformis CCMP3155]